MKEKILELIIQSLPAIIATFVCIISTFKVLNGVNTWKDSINESNLKQLSKDMKNVVKQNLELKNKLDITLQENEELKQAIKKDLEKVYDDIKALKDEAIKE